MNSRRDFLKKSAFLTLGTITASSVLNHVFGADPEMSGNIAFPDDNDFILEALPYAYDALEPHIDKMTMEIHHTKHYGGYITNLNKAMKDIDASQVGGKKSLNNIFEHMTKLPDAVRNNAGGFYNHFVFWKMMKPNGGGPATGKLGEEITRTFGSFDEFKKQFTDAAMKRFGSGWAWLVRTKEGKLVITSTANQDNPKMALPSVEVKGTPVLALDVWEHAYYLKNQNRRADYIASWWNVVNWETATNLFESKQ